MTIKDRYKIIAIIVTYGSRRNYLTRVIEGIKSSGITKIIVINNEAKWPVKTELNRLYNDFIDVIEMGKNSGSAIAFSCGIEKALASGAEYMWLLDDDNLPEETSLNELINIYESQSHYKQIEAFACLPYREDQYGVLGKYLTLKTINPRRNSFCNFHLLDIPVRIYGKFKSNLIINNGDLIPLDVAPYGGLFFNKKLIEIIGLPNSNLVLYADDTEFTWRITKNLGKILMTTSTKITDLEESWRKDKLKRRILETWFTGSSDFKVFYSMRNMSYFDFNYRARNRAVFFLNAGIYVILLYILSFRYKSRQRYKLLIRAITDGLHSKLGLDPNYPLP